LRIPALLTLVIFVFCLADPFVVRVAAAALARVVAASRRSTATTRR
jgi:hypothetical protein